MYQLSVFERAERGFSLLAAEGVVDALTYAGLQAKLNCHIRARSVVLDLSRVTAISSLGLGALISAAEDGKSSGNRLFLLNPSCIVRLAIETTGFSSLFPVVRSLAEAS